MLTKEFMTAEVISCTPDDTVETAARIMVSKGFSVVPVTDENDELLGIVTESDFVGKEIEIPHALASIKQMFGQNFFFKDIEQVYLDAKNKTLATIMSPSPKSIHPDSSLSEVVQLMLTKNYKKLPVVDGRKLVGIVTRKDLIKAFNILNS